MKWKWLMVGILPICTTCTQVEQMPGNKVAEKMYLELGKASQYVEITAEADNKPVLLFLHGGPGWPQTPMLRYFNADLSKKFVLVSWDQRGCGLSFVKDSTPANLNLNQLISDAHELTQYLKSRFKQQRIYLAGFSWGAIIGLNLAQKYPQDYRAYISISQVVNLEKGMELSRQWLEQEAQKKGDTLTRNQINLIRNRDTGYCRSPLDCFMKQYELVTKYKGAYFQDSALAWEEKAMHAYPDYKNYDWNKGFQFSVNALEKDLFAADFTGLTKLEIPVFFLAGKHDWNVPSVVTEMFYKNLNAPYKEFYWFKNSGHNLLQEEAEKFNDVMMNKILKQ